MPSANTSGRPRTSGHDSIDAESVCSSKSDKSRIDFRDKEANKAANPFNGAIGDEEPGSPLPRTVAPPAAPSSSNLFTMKQVQS
jgi:hypothetical protein